MDERRVNVRAYFRATVSIPVRYSLDGRLGISVGTINDISGGGVKLTADERLPTMGAVVLRFTLPESDDAIHVRARVVLSYPERPRGRHAHGVTFTVIDPPTRERIVRCVHHLQLRRLQEGKN
ncbi:MAG TPA: PilZ domain-containing protein [Candidatus Dormibacteraeota bacterium]|nr:PilZ domain-containing protein [Candidatus Dormibacteraeota bacterium]